MMWYGFKSSGLKNKKTIRNFKRRYNLKMRALGFFFLKRFNTNRYSVCLYIPSTWNFILRKVSADSIYQFFFYSDSYFFFLSAPISFSQVNYDRFSNNLLFRFDYINSFYKTYWRFFKNIFFSFSKLFFKKIKFKGKGYYIYRNIRNSVALQFGYSHRVRIYSYFLPVKFTSKTSVLLFGINKDDIFKTAYNLYYKKPQNIFTSRGIRFTRQIVYKKAGKISSYR